MSFTSFEWTYEIWVSQINVRKLQPKLKRLKTEMLLHRKFQYQMHLEHRLKCSWALNYFETNEITSYLNSVPRAQCTLCSCAPHDVVDFYIHDEKMQQCRIFCSALCSFVRKFSDAAGRRLVQYWLPHAVNGLRLNGKCGDFQKCIWFKLFLKIKAKHQQQQPMVASGEVLDFNMFRRAMCLYLLGLNFVPYSNWTFKTNKPSSTSAVNVKCCIFLLAGSSISKSLK